MAGHFQRTFSPPSLSEKPGHENAHWQHGQRKRDHFRKKLFQGVDHDKRNGFAKFKLLSV
jgi:hypothetical protein